MAGSPKNLQPIVHFVINILFVLGQGSAIARIWTRFAILKNFWWDDWAMVIIVVVNAGQHAILYLFISVGAGLPQEEVLAKNPEAMSMMQKYLFAEEIWYLFLHFWIKMSFLFFFLRLSRSRPFHIVVYCVMAANIFVTVGTWALYSLQCIPLEAFWYPERHPDVQCLPFSLSLWLPATALIVVDLAIFILPLSTVLSLQMSVKRRLQVLAVITTGGSSVIVSCLRLIVIYRFTVTDDFIWEVGNICIVSAAEMEVAILASNMPALRALWKKIRGDTLTSTGHSKQTRPSANVHTGDDDRRGHQLTNLFTNKSYRGAERLGDDDDKIEENSSTRELTRRTSSDEELENRNGGAEPYKGTILVTTEYKVAEEVRDGGQRDQHDWNHQKVDIRVSR